MLDSVKAMEQQNLRLLSYIWGCSTFYLGFDSYDLERMAVEKKSNRLTEADINYQQEKFNCNWTRIDNVFIAE